jgi:hypothetical protein
MPKLCDHCWKEIPTFATKCPYCHENPDSKGNVEIGLKTVFESFASYKFWITFIILIPFFGLIIFQKRDYFFVSLFISWLIATIIYIFFFRKINNDTEEQFTINEEEYTIQKYSLFNIEEQNQINKKIKITRVNEVVYEILRLKIDEDKELTLNNFKIYNVSEVAILWNDFKYIYLDMLQNKGIEDIENLYGTIEKYGKIEFLNSVSDKNYLWYHKLFCDTSFSDDTDNLLRSRDKHFDIKNDKFYDIYIETQRNKNKLELRSFTKISDESKISQIDFDRSILNKNNILIERLNTNDDHIADEKYCIEFV